MVHCYSKHYKTTPWLWQITQLWFNYHVLMFSSVVKSRSIRIMSMLSWFMTVFLNCCYIYPNLKLLWQYGEPFFKLATLQKSKRDIIFTRFLSELLHSVHHEILLKTAVDEQAKLCTTTRIVCFLYWKTYLRYLWTVVINKVATL